MSRYGGVRGRTWLASVPRLVAELAERWDLDVGEPYRPGGMTGVAWRVTRADGTPCVLKVRFPEPGESLTEGTALRHFRGGAAVAVVAEDIGRAALLLERCEPGTSLLDQPDGCATTVIAGLLAEMWSPPSPGHPFPRVAPMGARWVDTIVAAREVEKPLRDKASGLLRDLLGSQPDEVVLHGDLHAANVLRAARRPWLAIDPKGYVGERAYDCAAVLRDRVTAELAPRRLAIVTDLLGVNPLRACGWALAQAVEGAVWCFRTGDCAGGDAMVASAGVLATLV